jgi:hypothetical protein
MSGYALFYFVRLGREGPEPVFFTSPSSSKCPKWRRAVLGSTPMASAYSPDFALPRVASHCQPFLSDLLRALRAFSPRAFIALYAERYSVRTRYGSSQLNCGRGRPSSFARSRSEARPRPCSSAMPIRANTKWNSGFRLSMGALNPALLYLDEQCDIAVDGEVGTTELYSDYKRWCADGGNRALSRNINSRTRS